MKNYNIQQLHYGTLALATYCYCGTYKIQTFFKTLFSEKAKT